eukprot:1148522-Pelagomonas_calceolata.AAC.3
MMKQAKEMFLLCTQQLQRAGRLTTTHTHTFTHTRAHADPPPSSLGQRSVSCNDVHNCASGVSAAGHICS